ncbi:MAG: ferrous iron transport protein B [Candidatus Hydrogenedentes bacterium]|nr:ferrous iron transport protein B [Candidatus Hydrogenedentota bacterium]
MSATLAVVGNPNVGKTALFNALTGLSQNTGNYAGVTVERKTGRVALDGATAELIDLPGTYSLAASSPDEMIVVDVLLGQRAGEKSIDGLVAVVDASNLERNLYFVSQLLELEKPLVVALNMMDIAARRGLKIDVAALSEKLGVPVVPICAHRRIGLDKLREAMTPLAQVALPVSGVRCPFPEAQLSALQALAADLNSRPVLRRTIHPLEAFRVMVDENGYAEQRVLRKVGPEFRPALTEYRRRAQVNGANLAAQEARARYGWVREIMDTCVTRPKVRPKSRSERIDNILTHRVFGTVIFLTVMLLVFQSIYSWAAPVMDLIDSGISALGGAVSAWLPPGVLQSLVVDGIFAGVGSVLVFLPQIILLSLFIAILEDCGYMARAAFLMDKLFSWCGLSGQSFIPMLSSFACAIPGILATRTIKDRRDRFTTILVAPLMSCSARLPVYLILIGAFIPSQRVLGGLVGLEGLTLLAVYSLGVLVAIPTAWTLKRTLFRGVKPPFILEMPSYKVPLAGVVLKKAFFESREFVVRAGTLIFAVTIIVWALAYFPRSTAIAETYAAKRAQVVRNTAEAQAQEAALAALADEEEGEYLRSSLLGKIGHFIEPVFRPLGWDWRIATATIASFPAREIIVATLGTLFNMGADEDEHSDSLRTTLQLARREDGVTPVINIPVALSIMVFFALCCQCSATLVTIRRETGQWRWPLLTFGYMTTLAYLGALCTYQFTTALGWGG